MLINWNSPLGEGDSKVSVHVWRLLESDPDTHAHCLCVSR